MSRICWGRPFLDELNNISKSWVLHDACSAPCQRPATLARRTDDVFRLAKLAWLSRVIAMSAPRSWSRIVYRSVRRPVFFRVGKNPGQPTTQVASLWIHAPDRIRSAITADVNRSGRPRSLSYRVVWPDLDLQRPRGYWRVWESCRSERLRIFSS